MIYEFKITLMNVRPLVTRTIHIEEKATFLDLHRAIQLAFDWWDYHIHYFATKRLVGEKVKRVIILPNKTERGEHFIPNVWTKKDERLELIRDWFLMEGEMIQYNYDLQNNWSHQILFVRKFPKNTMQIYPFCTDAKNFAPPEESKLELLDGKIELRSSDNEDVIQKVNGLFEKHLCQFSTNVSESDQEKAWLALYEKTNEFYKASPWKTMSDQHIFGLYVEEMDEYLFCSVLGNNDEIYGFTMYIGYHGLLALYASLNESFSLETIFQYQESVLVQFEDHTKHPDASFPYIELMPKSLQGEARWPHFTSYQPGFYPWKVNAREMRLMTIALEETLYLHKRIQLGLVLPDFSQERKLLLQHIHANSSVRQKETVTLNQLMDKIYPVMLSISELDLKRLGKLKRAIDLTVEFAMKYVSIPIQRLNGNRPFFPLTTIIINHDDGCLINHNVYDNKLNGAYVQREFAEMLVHLQGIPKTILVDELIVFYLKPLLDALSIKVEVTDDSTKVDQLITNISDYLASKIK